MTGTNDENGKNCASLLLLLLLLLIVICDGAGMYNEMKVMDLYVDDDVVGICYQVCVHPFPQG